MPCAQGDVHLFGNKIQRRHCGFASPFNSWDHKVLTHVEYIAVSGVFQNIDPPPPLPLASASSPRTKGGGVHTRRAVRGVGGQYFGRRQTLDWPLTV
jgi:hypothetical protein